MNGVTDRIPPPRAPEAPAPYGFPVVATIAPVVASVAIWWLTNSPFALVFAALGPVTAVASLLDARVGSRRTSRRELARFRADARRVEGEIAQRHELERTEIAESVPAARDLVAPAASDPQRWSGTTSGFLPIALGHGPAPSRVRLDRPPHTSLAEVEATLEQLANRAGQLDDAPVIVDARLGIGVVGPAPVTSAIVRGIVASLARSLTPAEHWCSWSGNGGDWMSQLPHPLGPPPTARGPAIAFGARGDASPAVLVAHAEDEVGLPVGCRVVLRVDHDGARIVRHPDRELRRELHPELLSRAQAQRWAALLSADAERDGLIADGRALPGSVPLETLLAAPASGSGLACTPAIDVAGPALIDLVEHGPHAIVGGTTGSGKSELLVSWVLAMAAARSPLQLTLLLVDFKGGAAFAPLGGLPHVAGILTDLDGEAASRALESLRAELRYRERALVAAGARDIDGVEGLARLVIVVDEFAAMLGEHPELHALFTDLAARGRALGVHLVLCTQRPTGVVRDAVLANADLRICMRVNNRADSAAVVGSDAAAELPASARGRGILATPGTAPRPVQFAIASAEDVDAIAARWVGAPRARVPWLDPLPALVLPESLQTPGFGLLDLPDEQRRAVARWDPVADGHVLVLGAAGSGKTTALAALSEGGTLVPANPTAAWDAIESPRAGTLVLDDVDSLLARFAPEYRVAFAERLGSLLRDGPGRGIRLALSAQRVTGELQSLLGLVPMRLTLRHATRQDVLLAGGEAADYRADLPPGGGSWRGRRVQVAFVPPLAPADGAPLERALGDAPIAIVSPRPGALAPRLAGAVIALAAAPDVVAAARTGATIIGDVDEWQSRWGAIASLRGVAEVLLEGCSTADFRAITRSRDLPPPLDPQPGWCWRLEPDGAVSRARLPLLGPQGPGDATQASASASGR
jgi:S-DNA-T family DNA segregation ATPase FtsK/SpoIIIE